MHNVTGSFSLSLQLNVLQPLQLPLKLEEHQKQLYPEGWCQRDPSVKPRIQVSGQPKPVSKL